MGAVADGVPGAAGLLAAKGDDGVGAVDGPVHACLLESLPDGLAAGFHDAGAGEEAALVTWPGWRCRLAR